jgi:hypothetical protein
MARAASGSAASCKASDSKSLGDSGISAEVMMRRNPAN